MHEDVGPHRCHGVAAAPHQLPLRPRPRLLHPLPRRRVQGHHRRALLHHAPPPHCSPPHVQPRVDEHRAVLVARHRHRPRRRRPLPPPVPVARQAEGVAERGARRVAPSAQQQQPVGARRGGAVHARRRLLAALGDAPPRVRLLRRVERPGVAQRLLAVVAADGHQEAVGHQRQRVRVARRGPRARHHHAVPPRPLKVGEVQDVQVLGGQARGADAALHHHHVAHSRGGVRGARGGRVALRHHLFPGARPHVQQVHVVGGARQADAGGGGAGGGGRVGGALGLTLERGGAACGGGGGGGRG